MSYYDEKSLKNLSNYKYSSHDASILANYVLQPFWRWSANLLPHWLAPNLITLIGFLFPFVSLVIVYYYRPFVVADFAGEHFAVPSWVWYNAAFAMFAYQTLDALDGKQARRTGTSSPLGELFDHGCDAVTTGVVALSVCAALDVSVWQALAVLSVGMAGFYLAMWDNYFAGAVYFGPINVTEAQVMSAGIFVVTGLWGSEFWHTVALDLEPLVGSALRLQWNDVVFGLAVSVGALSAVQYLISGITQIQRSHTVTHALALLFPVALTLGLAIYWAMVSPYGILVRAPHLFLLSLNLVMASYVSKTVVARIVKERPPVAQWVSLPLPFCALNAKYGWISESQALYFFFAWSLGWYAHFAYYVITTVCHHLSINCLTLTAAQKKRALQLIADEQKKAQ